MADSFFDRIYKKKVQHTPDVLSCLSNLSNDEVFTPPDVVNQMLDLLPQELFTDPNTTFLDPACKTGVFLREIAKRLLVGLENQIPDLQERIDHIFHKQLYGIAITELTSLLSRRSLYCSKYPNGPYSITKFDNPEGNIRYRRINHTWVNGKCKYCGASEKQWSREDTLETYAYELIHTDNPERLFNMKFDVIISNPPYQLDDGGNGASAKPIYQLFVDSAKKLNPRYISMIIPARWYAGGKGLDTFRKSMLSDNHIRELHDFSNAADCFTGVEIKGGVCYFLWCRDSKGLCNVCTHQGEKIVSHMERPLLENNTDTFIRHNNAISILHKIEEKNEYTFDTLVSPRKPFSFPSNFRNYVSVRDKTHEIRIYAQKDKGYVSKVQIEKNVGWINKWKVFIPEAIGAGNMALDYVKPILGAPNTVCTETYVVVGPFIDEKTAKNVTQYIGTKFFHFLLGLKKITQHTTSKTYSFIPIQDFSKSWTDEELYKKYKLTQDEIDYIESSVWSNKEITTNGK